MTNEQENTSRFRSLDEKVDEMERRLTRIESRVVQLMMHFGMDPSARAYDQQDLRTHSGKKAK